MPIRFLFLSLTITALLTYLFIVSGNEIRNKDKQLLSKQTTIIRLGEQIIYLDEVLTMSTRLAAATGNKSWEDRYNKFESILTSKIEKAKILSSDLIIERFIEETENSNNVLVSMEQAAFLKINQGQLKEAKTILSSSKYMNHKKIYSGGISKLIKSVKFQIREKIKGNDQRIQVFFIICISIILTSWLILFLIFRKHFINRRKLELDLENHQVQLKNTINARTKELTSSKNYLSTVVTNLVDALITFNEKGIITMANPAALNLFGYSNEIIGENISKIVPELDCSKHDQYLQKYLETVIGKVIGIERDVQAIKKDGTLFPIHLGISKVNVGDDITYIATIHDLTERAHFEKDLQSAKEIAEKANEAKSEFLGRVSHELRTPMNAILGFTQLLQRDRRSSLNNDQKEYVENVYSAGNHLLELINEVLDLSRIETGNIKLALEVIDIIPIVDNVISISKPLADEQGISIDYMKTPEKSCFTEIDPLRFKQIIFNIISNAIKYNKPNGSVTVSYEKQENGKMRLGVKDTGRGVPENEKFKIFDPFERLNIGPEDIKGTGIGLTISKQLIELMNGEIGFESTVGVGSFCYIDLPIVEKEPKPAAVEITVGSANKIAESSGSKTVLYIEDIPVNVDLLRKILSDRSDIELISAPNALAGIKIAKTRIPDLILMDIHLPGMDGITAFKQLQTINETKNIPVIALTADAMNKDIKEAMEMGFRDYITKPIEIDRFLNCIDKVLTPD